MLRPVEKIAPLGANVVLGIHKKEEPSVVLPSGLEVVQENENAHRVMCIGPDAKFVSVGDTVALGKVCVKLEKFTPIYALNQEGTAECFIVVEEKDIAVKLDGGENV